MADELNKLPTEIQKLTDSILSVGEKISPPQIPISLPEDKVLSDREVMKRLLSQGGSSADPSVAMPDDVAHFTVYGKLPTDPDPYTPDLTKTAIKDNHPMMENIKSMKSELKTSLTQLGQKTKEILAATKQLISDVIQAIITLASSAVVLPFGAGVPTGLSAVMSIFSSLQAYQTKLMQVIPLLKPLSNIAILLPEADAEPLASTVNKALGMISEPLGLIEGLLDKLSIIGGKVTETQEQIMQIKVEITNSNPIVTSEVPESKLSAVATQGTWQYSYKWSSNKDTTFTSTEQEITVSPLVTTIYTCEVKDTNDPPSVKTATTVVHKNTISPISGDVESVSTTGNLPAIGGEEVGGTSTGTPTIVINMSDPNPYVDEIITFSASISTAGPWTYFWSFSGGATFVNGNANSVSPQISYSLDGTQRKASLSITNNQGNTYIAIRYFDVTNTPT